ncbi:MAG TPA: hypothetical protein VK111_11360 [Virgibacillus sp.]|nr:hypothetical protein [Virgibacillus sp.]
MPKQQTVQERYDIENKMKLTEKVEQNTVGDKALQQIFTQMLQALGETQQAVRQAQTSHPTDIRLKQADARLNHALRAFQQFTTHTNIQALVQGFPIQVQQQIKQLSQQLDQASETIQTIQRSISTH